MNAKFQTSLGVEFEGAITSSSNIRPDEIILKIDDRYTCIYITFLDGKKIELPLHLKEEDATLIIPEKIYKEAEKEPELEKLLNGLFDHQRNFNVKVEMQKDKIVIQPVGTKKALFKFVFVR